MQKPNDRELVGSGVRMGRFLRDLMALRLCPTQLAARTEEASGARLDPTPFASSSIIQMLAASTSNTSRRTELAKQMLTLSGPIS